MGDINVLEEAMQWRFMQRDDHPREPMPAPEP